MKKLLTSTAIILALGGCASNNNSLPSIERSAPLPYPINSGYVENVGTTLPLIDAVLIAPSTSEKASSPGTKRPRKSEMRGNTWVPGFDRDNEYIVPVQTTNHNGSRTVQQVLVSSDLPVGQGSCAHSGFQVVPMGTSVAIAPLPGAPVGTQVSCAISFGGQMVKVIVEASEKRGLSELRLEGRKKRPSFPTGVCSDAKYTVSEIVEGGPLGACVVVDATGANSATYVKLPGNAYEMPVVETGDGQNARLSRSSIKRLPDGSRLVRIQGPQKQVVLRYPNGKVVALTRGM